MKYLGMITDQYDDLTERMEIFQKDKYYFVLKCQNQKGMLSDLERIIKEIK